MENRYLAKNIIAHSFHPSLFLSISWVIDYVASPRFFLAMLWNALHWKILSEISKTAGKLDLPSVWEDELDDFMVFFAHGFLSCFVCMWFSQLGLF